MPDKYTIVVKEYNAEVLANDWKAKRFLIRKTFAVGCGIDVVGQMSDEDGNYHETQYPGLNNPLEFAIEFRKKNTKEKDIGYRGETLFVDGKLHVRVGVVMGPPKKNVCSEGVCECEEDPC